MNGTNTTTNNNNNDNNSNNNNNDSMINVSSFLKSNQTFLQWINDYSHGMNKFPADLVTLNYLSSPFMTKFKS